MTGIPTVIVDVDGTLVDVSGVRHYVLDDPRRKDFDSFHGKIVKVRGPLPYELATLRAWAAGTQ